MSQLMSTVLNSFMHSWISFTEVALFSSQEKGILTELRLKAAWECSAAKLNITHATS